MWQGPKILCRTEVGTSAFKIKNGWDMTKRIKKERIASIVAGSLLFILAAIFTIAIFLRIFDYGTESSERGAFLNLGHMLYSAYGFCSLLIPLFFIVAGAFCFDSRWSVQRAMCLIVSPLPFMTLVLVEKLIRSSLTGESHAIAFVKITLLSVVAILLIAVEYLITIIIAGKMKKRMATNKSSNVTSAPVFERRSTENPSADGEEKENALTRFINSVAEKFKSFTKKESGLTAAPGRSFENPSSTVEIVLEEENRENYGDESDEDDDNDEFQAPTVSDDFFEEKKTLLVDSGDDDISQIEEEDEPTTVGQKIVRPFKNLFKKAQSKYKDIMDYGEMQDKENSASTGTPESTVETEAVDINDFFKKPAERVVLKEDDYSDLDLPPRQKVQNTIVPGAPYEPQSTLEYSQKNPTIIVDERDDKDEHQQEELDQNTEEIDISEFENSEFETNEADEEDIIGMFERQNQTRDENDFLEKFKYPEDSAQDDSLGSFIDDDQDFEDEAPEPIEAEKQNDYENEDEYQEENTESFLTQIRNRINGNENQKTPAQRMAEYEEERLAKIEAEKAEAEHQKKLREEKLYAQIREELKAKTRKPSEFNFVPDLKSEVSTAGADLNDVFAKMDRDVRENIENDPQYKSRFSTQIEDTQPENKATEDSHTSEQNTNVQNPVHQGILNVDENLSEIQQRHKSFIARAEALKAAREAEKQSKAEEPKQSPKLDYVFGNPEPDVDSDSFIDSEQDFEHEIVTDSSINLEQDLDPLAGSNFIDDEVISGVDSDQDEAQPLLSDAAEDEELSVEVEAEDSYQDDTDDPEDFSEEENGGAPVDYVFREEKKQPPKSAEWKSVYNIPYDLLTVYEDNPYWIIDDETKAAAENLKNTLAEFKIDAEVTGIQKGPVITMFEILPAPGIKLNRIAALADNIALRLAANSVRIVAPIPGKHAVGIEVPNSSRAIISIRECLETDRPEWSKMGVPVVLGKDIQGNSQIIDLVKTPHLLIAGATGAGKSVCVNSMIVSMLYKRSPRDVKMILIDPKIVELKLYNDIPHLLTPVITEPKRAMQALQYCLCEMERRYALLDGMSVRDISSYNEKIVAKHIATEKLPYLIVIIDEFADLMATTGKQLEGIVSRLAAMSRAVGIHLVLATQRPSIDVITGLIKANIPSRIAFMVASKIDSRIILDLPGAEKLLGKGDMLYTSATDPFPIRIQGTFVSDQEVENIVNAVKAWGEPEYIDDEIFIDDDEDEDSDDESLFNPDAEDPLYEKALDIVVQAGKASASYIQRRLKIGYNRAARLVEEMEERGIVGPANGSKPREIIHMP